MLIVPTRFVPFNHRSDAPCATVFSWEDKNCQHPAMAGGHVYILGSHTGTLYIGVTSDLYVRVMQHKENTLEGFTATKRFAQDDDFVGGRRTADWICRKQKRSKKSQALRMTILWEF